MSMKVLIAEGDFRFAQQAGGYLERFAHMVAYEARPAELLERVEQWKPDLLILSAELAEAGVLAEMISMDNRPAVLLTEFMDRYDRAWRAWQIGGDEVLLKPIFSTDDLHAAIVTALENRTDPAGRICVTAVSA